MWLQFVILQLSWASCHGLMACDRSTYAVPSPESVLPTFSSLEALHVDESEFSDFFARGLHECNSKLNNLRGKPQDVFAKEISMSAAVIFQKTGLLFWPFGPVTCLLHSKCWFGVLSCGQVNETQLQNEYLKSIKLAKPGSKQRDYVGKWVHYSDYAPHPIIDKSSIPEYLGWSLRSFHVHTIINGSEVVVPRTQLVSVTDSNDTKREVLVNEYVLTIPGTYHVDSRVQAFYPGILYGFNKAQRAQGLDMQHMVAFGTVRHNGPNPKFDFLKPDTRLRVVASFDGECDEHRRHDSLPYCTNGNHPGRWINLPREMLETCKATYFIGRLDRLSGSQLDQRKQELFQATLQRMYVGEVGLILLDMVENAM
jgi:hypothetical protein